MSQYLPSESGGVFYVHILRGTQGGANGEGVSTVSGLQIPVHQSTRMNIIHSPNNIPQHINSNQRNLNRIFILSPPPPPTPPHPPPPTPTLPPPHYKHL